MSLREMIAEMLYEVVIGVSQARAQGVPAEMPKSVEFVFETDDGIVEVEVPLFMVASGNGKAITFSWADLDGKTNN